MRTRHSQPLFALFIAFSFALTGLAAFPAHAQSLTEDRVRAFIDSMKEAETLATKYEDELEALQQADPANRHDGDMSRMFSRSLEAIKGHEFYGELESLADDHGFDSVEEWATTGDQVFQAWMALEMEQQDPAMQAEMEAAMAEMENNPHMSEAQKAQMRAMMQSATTSMRTAQQAPESAKAAVRPFVDELRAISEADRGQ
jgi:hypothetical protein